MLVSHLTGLFRNPKAEWARIRDQDYSIADCLLRHTLVFALIPAVSGFIGTTQIGWRIGVGEPVRLTLSSALPISIMYYLAMITAVFSVGWMIRWMGETYGADQPLSRCLILASYTATPLFIISIMQLYPLLWLNLVAGLPALAYTAYFFYSGVPVMMDVSEDRGFLFSSAVLAFGLVALVAMLAVTVLLWSAGFDLAFTR